MKQTLGIHHKRTMTNTKILFLHGFFASGYCIPAQTLKQAFANKAEVFTPDLPLHPREALAFITNLCECEHPDVLVGNSNGAFLAQIVASRLRIPALLGNPYLEMTRFLSERIGPHEYKSPRTDGRQHFVIDQPLIEEFADVQCAQIREYKYAQWFNEVQYNGKTLSESERQEFISIIDSTIAQYSEGLPLMTDILEDTKERHDEYYKIDRIVVSVCLFVLITMIDSMVAGKYFILADRDYDQRFMRGKLFVILNEGFKKLYGFNEKSHNKSEWNKLRPIMKYFPKVINRQYQDLTHLLEKQSYTSSWWKDERNYETHLDAEKLYKSRQEEIIESKVMMDSLKLFETLLAVSHFLSNVHACIFNFLVGKYRRGELSE